MIGKLATIVPQAAIEEGELHVDVMRFFAIIAVCLFAVLSEVGGQSNHAVTETAKTPNTLKCRHQL